MRKLFVVISIFLFFAQTPAQSLKVSGRLQKALDNAERNKSVTVWIYFKDKGNSLYKSSGNAVKISARALKRREKVLKNNNLTDQYDLPVYKPYIKEISKYIRKKRVQSRWLNAVSAEMDAAKVSRAAALPFVKRIDLVQGYKRSEPLPESQDIDLKRSSGPQSYDDSLAYLIQIQQIKVDKLQEKGLYGEGVLICMLDDGYRLYRQHEVFDSTDIVDTWDFINNDSTVDDTGYAMEGFHGSMTLSTIGGYAPGKLIGTAYKASFMLAKTEIDSAEKPIEEDYWVAGLEWADSGGADIVSSSLGYIDWYTWEDMDGETPVTTQATIIAEQKGLLIVNSAGNEGSCDSCNTLIAPADGEFVLTVGAVNSQGYRTSFSSVGPTYDGRIKPDVMAMGYDVTVASYTDPNVYLQKAGTSFSCPLTAGAAALLIEANPHAAPAQIRDALRNTASQAQNPDRFMGWGIVNADSASDYLNFMSIDDDNKALSPQTYILSQNYPNPFNPFTSILVYLPENGEIDLDIYSVLGRKVKTLVRGYYTKGLYHFNWNGKNDKGVALSSGTYIYTLKTSNTVLSKKMTLLR